jgi:hypothetical protein
LRAIRAERLALFDLGPAVIATWKEVKVGH